MKYIKLVVAFWAMSLVLAFGAEKQKQQVKHVVLIGLDGLGANGLQRAATPRMNEMIKDGALSIHARCIRETSSSQNWMTMLTGALPEQHGVTSNKWEPDNHLIEPVLKNRIGLFPSIFDLIKAQLKASKVYMFYEWEGLGRMFDLKVPDKVKLGKSGVSLFHEAIDAFFEDKPELLFVDIDEIDHSGHEHGHEAKAFFDCITKYDSIIGTLIDRLKAEDMLDETVVIVTADHGGIKKGHGGDTPDELEIPILLYGGKVTKGKMIEHGNLIADIAPTVAGLLGVTMPQECVGKFIHEAFEPKTKVQYAPMPLFSPNYETFKDSVEISIRADWPDARIYYTTDGTEPNLSSSLYTKPIVLKSSTQVRASALVGHTFSVIANERYQKQTP